MKSIFYIFIFLCMSMSYAQQDSYLESLGVIVNNERTSVDKSTIDELNATAKDSVYVNSELCERYGRIAYSLSHDIEYAEGEIDALLNISGAMLYTNREDSALVYTDLALQIAQRIKSERKIIKAHSMKGSTYDYLGKFDLAVKEYFKAIQIAERIDPKLALIPYANIGRSFKTLDNLPKSREYTTKAYESSKKYNDTGVMVVSLNLLGLIEKTEGNHDQAIAHFEEGLSYARSKNLIERQSHILYNLANIYFDKKEYEHGLKLFNESVEISKVNGSYLQIAIGFHSLAFTYCEMRRLNEAASIADSAMVYAMKSGNYEIIMESYALHAEIAKQSHRHKDALRYLEIAYEYKDSLNHSKLNSAALEVEDNFEKEKRRLSDSLENIQRDLEAAHIKKENDQKLKSREILLWIAGLVLVVILFGIYYLKKNNVLIKKQNRLVQKQKEELSHQHNEIKDSIQYAKRIQDAIISNKDQWQTISKEHFILFKPKDVVSGDFYWAHHDKTSNISIWAVADCTGHGVPGAFMSMLGVGLLNEIIIENGEREPGIILNQLRTKIIAALTEQGESTSKDGMDIALCVWHREKQELHFAGANNPVWIIRSIEFTAPMHFNKEIENQNSGVKLYDIAGDKMPIGYYFATPPPFTTRVLELFENDSIILLSDGFADQFGGTAGKKLKNIPLKNRLLEIHNMDNHKQEEEINAFFESWRGQYDQVDDVCMIRVKVTS